VSFSTGKRPSANPLLGTWTLKSYVDISWNEVWNGTDQVRLYEVNGSTLTITSRLTDPTTDTEARYDLVWERVATPH